MEDKKTFIEPLFERVEEYGKTSFELIKLKALGKVVHAVSAFVSRGIMVLIFLVVMVFANIGVAFWLSDLLGKLYYGFFCVAAFYVVVGFVLYFLREPIKKCLGNSIVSHLLN